MCALQPASYGASDAPILVGPRAIFRGRISPARHPTTFRISLGLVRCGKKGILLRKIVGIGFLLGLLGSLAAAQVPTSGNVFFGYSYYNTDISTLGRSSANGWEGSLEGKVFPFLGIVADFDGHYGSPSYPSFCSLCTSPTSVSASTPQHNVLFGPRVSVSVGKFRPFGEFLVGIGHASISGGPTDTSLASAVGGGLDYRLIRLIAWRLQGDYVHTHLYGAGQNNVRISTGIVLRF